MFKIPPKSWGQLKQVDRKHYHYLKEVLIPLLPRSRRIIETLNACLNNCFDIWDQFYIPEDEEFNSLSGIIVVLMNQDSTISFISKEKDVDKVLNIIDASIDWENYVKFGPVADWYIPGMIELCHKHGKIKNHVKVKQYENTNTAKLGEVKSSITNIDSNSSSTSIQEFPNIMRFHAKNGQTMFAKPLGPEYANFISDNWKFKSDSAFLWIKSQCQSNMAFGTFTSLDLDSDIGFKEPNSWIMAYTYCALGLLKTKEDWRGNGCAIACIKSLSNYLLKFGITPYCFIEDFNQTSMRLFEKLGFEKTHNGSWIIYSPDESI